MVEDTPCLDLRAVKVSLGFPEWPEPALLMQESTGFSNSELGSEPFWREYIPTGWLPGVFPMDVAQPCLGHFWCRVISPHHSLPSPPPPASQPRLSCLPCADNHHPTLHVLCLLCNICLGCLHALALLARKSHYSFQIGSP